MTVRIEKDGKVWTVIHSRPQARNAMDPASADALVAAFREFDRDAGAAVAVLWGEGGAFCAGWDLKYGASLSEDPSELHEIDYPLDDREAIPRGPMGPTRLELDKPVIAAVAGPAVAGGFELALWCDLRVMERSAYFGVYCRRWGVPLIDGGTVRLPRIVGLGRALEIILTGRRVPAEEALRIGACEHVVEDGGARLRRGVGAGDRPLPAGLRARRPPLGLHAAGARAARCHAQGVVQRLPRVRRRGRGGRGTLRFGQGQARRFQRPLSSRHRVALALTTPKTLVLTRSGERRHNHRGEVRAGMHHVRHGGGAPPLVFVHGFACDHSDWRFQLDALRGRHEVVACDLRGHGATPGRPHECSIEHYGGDVAALLGDLGLPPAILVGHSMGCRVVLEAARLLSSPDGPGRVAGLVLVDGSRLASGDPDAAESAARAAIGNDYGAFAEDLFRQMFFRRTPESEAIVARAVRGSAETGPALWPRVARWDAARLDAALAALRAPLLAIQSTTRNAALRRAPIEPGDTNPWLELLKAHGGRVEIVPAVGHFTQLEAPERVNQLIAEFAAARR